MVCTWQSLVCRDYNQLPSLTGDDDDEDDDDDGVALAVAVADRCKCYRVVALSAVLRTSKLASPGFFEQYQRSCLLRPATNQFDARKVKQSEAISKFLRSSYQCQMIDIPS